MDIPDKKHVSIGFLVIFAGLVLMVTGHNFVRFYIEKDYPVYAFTACNAAVHNCFISESIFGIEPYAKVEMAATHAPKCLDEHSCVDFSCEGMVGYCNVTYCSEDTKDPEETCSLENK